MGLYKEMHEVALEDIEQKVQHPPPGVFDHRDLTWDVIQRHYGGNHKSRFVMQCYIPTDRVHDFRQGEETREGAKCQYVSRRVVDYTTNGLSFPRINSCYYVDRYIFNPW